MTRADAPQEALVKAGDSLYKTVLLAARRALELSQGAPPLVPTTSKQPGTVALEEIRQGKVAYRVPEGGAKEAKDTKKKREKSE